jgi:hypothetical protein
MGQLLRRLTGVVLMLLCAGCSSTPGPLRKPQYATPMPPKIQSAKEPESKSWLPSLSKPDEPEQPKTVDEWMRNTKRLDP